MARIKIEDLPVMEDLSEKEIKGIFGGITAVSGKERCQGQLGQRFGVGNVVSRLRGESGAVNGAIDDMGRYRVSFMFDTE